MNKTLKNILLVILIILLVSIAFMGYTYFTFHKTSTLAKMDIGYVTKEENNFYHSNLTMVIITGIHPRETLAIGPEVEATRMFSLTHQVNMITYNVTVTQDPEDYSKGRANGEKLVAEKVLPDINKTDAKIVIISHSHIPGYGEGFYVATPAMDQPSVSLAEKIKNSGIDFNYYPAREDMEYKSTSAVLVSKPLAESGYPTLVYEIPENITESDSTSRTMDLLETSYKLIKNS